jgi:transcriptional regulator GlxA family with amidase domain
MLPGGLDVVFEHGHEQLVILIDLSLVHSQLPAEVVEGLELAAAGHRLPANQEDVRYLGSWLSGLIDSANQTPEMLHSPSALRSIAEDVMRHLVSAVSLSFQPPSRPTYSARKKGLDRALEYLRHADLENQSIPEVSKAAGVSQRTLEYAFRGVFGLTPLAFLRLRRMHAARRDLLCESPEKVTVMAIAYRHGFYHPARFAKNYRQLFGEQPSATLTRSCQSKDQNLSPLLG